ncbi:MULTISPECIES: DUF3592 domain-containing protein [unclassified Streptomyces]|uniref:DUF3592 domain-containing protein n=1 Tax=unclassified Streptomyces TaxID=2593676 RepID=UPI0011CDBE13|nr:MULTISPECIES: DUF3592 domain-containing protein [unclassified Streptomyces]TXS76291.1 DUF3592 domain-containing protein [Streptomyces sp. me109]
MDVIFYVVPALIMAGATSMAVLVVRRSLDMRRAWNSGLTAEARCLRSYATTSGGGDTSVSTTLHHVYEFTTRDGRTIRFEEANGPATVLDGDIVTVHYSADRPQKATAHAPRRGLLAAGTVFVLVFCTVVVLLCAGFMVGFHAFSSAWDSAWTGREEFEGAPLPF